MGVVGTNVPMKDGPAKVGGTAKYVDDLTFPGMLHGRPIRSTIRCGRLTSLHLDFDTAGFTSARRGLHAGRAGSGAGVGSARATPPEGNLHLVSTEYLDADGDRPTGDTVCY